MKNFPIGSKVKLIVPASGRPYGDWGSVVSGAVGRVVGIDRDGDTLVDFPNQKRWAGKAGELGLVIPADGEIHNGTKVAIYPEHGAKDASRGWGQIRRGDVGEVTGRTMSGLYEINFKKQSCWLGSAGEVFPIEVATDEPAPEEPAKYAPAKFYVVYDGAVPLKICTTAKEAKAIRVGQSVIGNHNVTITKFKAVKEI